MLRILKNIFGLKKKPDLRVLVQNGAQIIDVRTRREFESGHIANSLNIPLQDLDSRLSSIKKDRPVITCCASGMRSASALGILKSRGFKDVHNGGGWMTLQNKIG